MPFYVRTFDVASRSGEGHGFPLIRVLYAGAANLIQPTSGMDIASRCQFEELSDDQQLAVTAISVCPTPFGPVPAGRPVQLFTSDDATLSPSKSRLAMKLALLARGGILFQTGFVSDAARKELETKLADHPDVLFIDHIAALANISFLRLLGIRLRGRTKIVVVAHDISSKLLRDRALIQRSSWKTLAIRLHAVHSHIYETIVYALAHRVVFISAYDRNNFHNVVKSKTDAMCQIIEMPPDESGSATDENLGRYLIFVGSPSFFPNAFAIEWITRRFAPQILARLPDMKILLVGKGTDRPDPGRPANVVGLGFVDDQRLNHLLRGSCGTLSPVIHGAGIKIKVLESIAAGCAIFATEESMHGYEFMQLEPLLDVDDPETSADRVCAIAGDPAKLAAFRAQIDARWQDFKRFRRGKLAEIVKRVVGVPSDAAVVQLDGPIAH